jgi:hypothetical protein
MFFWVGLVLDVSHGVALPGEVWSLQRTPLTTLPLPLLPTLAPQLSLGMLDYPEVRFTRLWHRFTGQEPPPPSSSSLRRRLFLILLSFSLFLSSPPTLPRCIAPLNQFAPPPPLS